MRPITKDEAWRRASAIVDSRLVLAGAVVGAAFVAWMLEPGDPFLPGRFEGRPAMVFDARAILGISAAAVTTALLSTMSLSMVPARPRRPACGRSATRWSRRR